jgi:hypothetical protein
MSAGAIFQEALRIVVNHHLAEESQNDLVAALEAGNPGPLTFLYEAGAEAKLSPKEIVDRAVAIFFCFCALNLCDDLSDGDCSYFSEPYRTGPCADFLLQVLFFELLGRIELPRSTLRSVLNDLFEAGGAQLIELRNKKWTAPVSRLVGEGIGGRQWSAYMQILWSGTSFSRRAPAIGMNIGFATYVFEDIQSGDRRFVALSRAHKRQMLEWAASAVGALRAERIKCLDTMLETVEPVLQTSRLSSP